MKYLILLIFATITLPEISCAQKIELINSGELLKRGAMVHDSGQYKKALSIYNKISRNDTSYVRSLYERAMTCEADSQYKQAIKYCEEAFSLHEQRDYVPDLYNVYGNTLHEDGQAEKALIVFDAAIAKYPSYALFYFNKGVVQLALKRYAEAETLFQKTLLINPYLYSAHYQLGLAALRQGKTIPAYLCFTGYLLVNPSGKYWSKSINALSQISKGTDEILDYKNKRTVNPDDNYQAVEDIVLSKIALDKGYKPIIALDDQISRQIQAIFEKLEYSDSNNDFYIQYYFPYYKKVFAEGKFELFINHIFTSATVPIIQDYLKKNKKALDVFVNEAGDYFNLLRATRELSYKKRDLIDDRYYFENGKLVGKGVLTNNGKTLTGHWEFYYPAGDMKGLGEYNAQGQREGEWTFYYASGNLKSKERHKNGKLEGEVDHYFENGNISSQEPYVDDKLEGPATTYYYGGNIKLTGNYKQGKKEGESREYYSNGNLYTVGNYVADMLTGTSKEYYKSGSIKEIQENVNGKAEGSFKSYHEGGSLSVTGQNTKDKGYGEWKYYYDSGKLKEKRNYLNDTEEGLHEEYFENGQVSATYAVKKGKINGDATFFYKDGKVLSKYVYDNGVIRSAKYFDKTGAQLAASEMKNNLIDVTSYDTDGLKKARFSSDSKGDLTGPDTLFYSSGKINQIAQYSKGELNGPLITYYLNGKKKSEISYTDGKENGYSTQYYTNGKIELEGWIIDGKDQGEWDYYDEKGRLSIKTYHLDGELNGYKEEYRANGQKYLEQKYYNGWLEKMTQYDNDGKVLIVDSFPKATGKFVLYHPNMKVMTECNYVKGEFDGFYKTYFFDGSLSTSAFYKKGIQDSTYLSFYYGGAKNTVGLYKAGSKTGEWKFYDEDGKLHTTTNYVNDQKNGAQVRFFTEGTKDQVSIYKNDQLDGTYIKNNADGTLAYQVNFEEGKAKAYTYPGKDGQLVIPIPISPANDRLNAHFPNGKLARECAYSGGVKNGMDIMYYANGQVWTVDTSAYSISEGSYKEYYPDGKLKFDYPYTADNVDGICREFNPNGTLKKEEPYDNGSYQGPVKYFDAGGKLVKTMWYLFGTLTAVKNEK
ncbi:tetratricopeptide repeat protein [Mucilaginibacter sp. McL0603]|uniref:tetratricopeptide repeat protein n=1 Tax=Mucilaginibacter sp. McL0603 TaxID=3415670 RepID=UPI003CF5119E